MHIHNPSELLKNFRIQLGLTQQNLAEKLQTTRSQISMAESGQRPLPAESERLLAQLIQPFNSPQSPEKNIHKGEVTAEDILTIIKELKLQESKVNLKKLMLKRKLHGMEKNYNDNILAYNNLRSIIATIKAEEISREIHFQLQYYKSTLDKNGERERLLIQLQIDLLMAEATVITSYLERYQGRAS